MFSKISTVLKNVAFAFLLFVLTFEDGYRVVSPGLLGLIFKKIKTICNDPETQWMVFICLAVYSIAFLFFRSRANQNFWRHTFGLVFALLISTVLYFTNDSLSTQALILIGGALLGQGVAIWAEFEYTKNKIKGTENILTLVISVIVIFLTFSVILDIKPSRIYEYGNHVRWSGPWNNPNMAGLLMGTGFVLAIGFIFCVWPLVFKTKQNKIFILLFYILAAIFVGHGLLQSYSRGAWFGTICGLIYFSIQTTKYREPRLRQWAFNNIIYLVVITLSLLVLFYWQFNSTDKVAVRRAFSVVNQNDFSWHNRIAAWKGDLQMIAERPLLGFGWNQPELVFGNYYLPPKLSEGAAIEMNDYLIFGATAGIPALAFFGLYLWTSITKKVVWESKIQNPELTSLDYSKTACHSGAIVLLVGFWFDGGLFELSTAAIFWILLELGNVKNTETYDIVKLYR